MKTLTLVRLALLGAVLSAPALAQNPPPGAAPGGSASPTATAAVKKHGRMMKMNNGQLEPLPANLPLANGSILRPDGMLLMPNGQQMPLSEGEQVTMSGTVMPAPQPAARRLTHFNKHMEAGQMPKPR